MATLTLMSAMDALKNNARLTPKNAVYAYPVDPKTGEMLGDVLDTATPHMYELERYNRKFPGCQFELLDPMTVGYLWDDLKVFNPDEDEHIHRAETLAREYAAQDEARQIQASQSYQGNTRSLSLDDLKHARVDWLIDGLIARQSVNFLVAKRNTGKTFLYIDMVFSMITGRPFLGMSTRPARVLIVLGEGVSGFYSRMEAWAQYHGVDFEGEIAPSLAFVADVNLANEQSRSRLKQVADDFEPDFVIIDTWAASAGIIDEKDNALANLTITRAKEALSGAAVLFAAHPPHALADTTEPRMRGASAAADTADAVMTLWRDKSFKTGIERNYLALSTEEEHAGKNRNAKRITLHGLYVESVDLGDGEESAVLLQDDAAGLSVHDRWCLDNLPVGEALTMHELIEYTGKTRNTISKHVNNSTLVERDRKANTYTLKAAKAPNVVEVGAQAFAIAEKAA